MKETVTPTMKTAMEVMMGMIMTPTKDTTMRMMNTAMKETISEEMKSKEWEAVLIPSLNKNLYESLYDAPPPVATLMTRPKPDLPCGNFDSTLNPYGNILYDHAPWTDLIDNTAPHGNKYGASVPPTDLMDTPAHRCNFDRAPGTIYNAPAPGPTRWMPPAPRQILHRPSPLQHQVRSPRPLRHKVRNPRPQTNLKGAFTPPAGGVKTNNENDNDSKQL